MKLLDSHKVCSSERWLERNSHVTEIKRWDLRFVRTALEVLCLERPVVLLAHSTHAIIDAGVVSVLSHQG